MVELLVLRLTVMFLRFQSLTTYLRDAVAAALLVGVAATHIPMVARVMMTMLWFQILTSPWRLKRSTCMGRPVSIHVHHDL